MSWILGLDIGDMRVGTALGDSETRIAFPHRTLLRAKGNAEREIVELVSERNIQLIVAGLPVSEDGSENAQCEKVRNFCRRLGKRVSVKVVFTDEYASTLGASDTLAAKRAAHGHSGGRQSGDVDAAAAAVILESYFESHNDERDPL